MKTQAQKLNAIKMSEQPTPETDAEWDKYIRHPYTHGAGDLRILLQRLERERDEARELLRILVGLVAYGLGQSGEEWSLDAMRQATAAIQNAKSLEETK